MENLSNSGFDPEDELRASSELLRLKLEMDYNMKFSHASELPPEVENKWLANIYKFEEQYKNSVPAKVRVLLGNPSFPQSDNLTKEEIQQHLHRVKEMMKVRNMILDCCCEYDDKTIYDFIINELFEHETDSVFIEGMTWHFIYEEFHPNHKYDLTRHASQFIDTLLTRKWEEDFDVYKLNKVIRFKGKEFTQSTISEIIKAFQAAHSFFEVEEVKLEEPSFDISKRTGQVKANLKYVSYPREDTPRRFIGVCIIDFHYDISDWDICGFEFPGLG